MHEIYFLYILLYILYLYNLLLFKFQLINKLNKNFDI